MTPPIFDAGKADPDGVPYNDYFTCKAEARLAHRLWALARYDLDRGADCHFPGTGQHAHGGPARAAASSRR